MPAFIGFARDESGVAAIEYALIGGLIALVIIAAMTLVGSALSARFAALAGSFT
jgi:pilus assembly protein Flp/PilA